MLALGLRGTGVIGTNHEFAYRCLAEPDWRRLPGFRNVPRHEWESARWQRLHSARSVGHLREVFGDFLSADLAGDIEADQRERATMPLLIPPQMLNTMREHDLHGDPIRRYMAPRYRSVTRCGRVIRLPRAIRLPSRRCGRSRG